MRYYKRVNKRRLGSTEEEAAADFLDKLGYNIITRNFRCRQGEIDIIAEAEGILCFIEVKYRSSIRAGSPGEAINYKKQQIIYKVAEYYIYKNGLSFEMPCRFDAVIIEGENIKLIKDAFGGLSS